jgi:hypothetical protein
MGSSPKMREFRGVAENRKVPELLLPSCSILVDDGVRRMAAMNRTWLDFVVRLNSDLFEITRKTLWFVRYAGMPAFQIAAQTLATYIEVEKSVFWLVAQQAKAASDFTGRVQQSFSDEAAGAGVDAGRFELAMDVVIAGEAVTGVRESEISKAERCTLEDGQFPAAA